MSEKKVDSISRPNKDAVNPSEKRKVSSAPVDPFTAFSATRTGAKRKLERGLSALATDIMQTADSEFSNQSNDLLLRFGGGDIPIGTALEEERRNYSTAIQKMDDAKSSYYASIRKMKIYEYYSNEPFDLFVGAWQNKLKEIHLGNISRIELKNEQNFLDYYSELPLEERLDRLEIFSRKSGGAGVADFARRLFPELFAARDAEKSHADVSQTDVELPTAPPCSWSTERLESESPPEFIMRVYGPWMGKGLTMADVRHLDEPLAQSLYHHIRKGHSMPEGFDLPTKHEQRERMEAARGSDADISRREYLRQKQARYRENRRNRGGDAPTR